MEGRGNRGRIGAEIRSWEEKQNIMGRKKKLGQERIFIDNDLTWAERKAMERVREVAKEKKRKGWKLK